MRWDTQTLSAGRAESSVLRSRQRRRLWTRTTTQCRHQEVCKLFTRGRCGISLQSSPSLGIHIPSALNARSW